METLVLDRDNMPEQISVHVPQQKFSYRVYHSHTNCYIAKAIKEKMPELKENLDFMVGGIDMLRIYNTLYEADQLITCDHVKAAFDGGNGMDIIFTKIIVDD